MLLILKKWGSRMREVFDLLQFEEYREDNRKEVKKASAGLPISLWDTYSAFANCYGGVIISYILLGD